MISLITLMNYKARFHARTSQYGRISEIPGGFDSAPILAYVFLMLNIYIYIYIICLIPKRIERYKKTIDRLE